MFIRLWVAKCTMRACATSGELAISREAAKSIEATVPTARAESASASWREKRSRGKPSRPVSSAARETSAAEAIATAGLEPCSTRASVAS